MDDTATTGTTPTSPSSGGFEAALEAASARVESPPTPTSSDASSTPPAAGTPGTSGDPQRSEFIPRARFDEINTRMQRAEQAQQQFEEYKRQHGWAETPEAQFSRSLVQKLSADPIAFLGDLVQQLQNSPQFAPQLRSQAARILGAARGANDPEPQPDAQDEQGRPGFSYAQMQKHRAWERRQFEASLEQRLQPLQQTQQQLEQERQYRALSAKADQTASQLYQEMQAWPNYKEHEPAIRDLLVKHPNLQPHQAYLHVLKSNILPGYEQRVLASLQQKAQAQTVNPSAGHATTPGRPRNWEDALAWAETASR